LEVSKIYHWAESLDKHFFSSAYRATTENRDVEFKPEIRQGLGVVYDLFGIEVPEEKMKYYLERGYIEVVKDVSLPACNICEDVCIRPLIVCPDCSSNNIEKKELMVHYDCNYMGSEEEFMQSQSRLYRCPKCGKELKRVGIDYGRPGFGYICRDCRSIFQIPLIWLICEKGHKNKVDELTIKKYPIYKLSNEIKKLLPIYNVVEDLVRELTLHGLRAEGFKHVKGISGTTYTIPIFIDGSPSIIVEFGLSGEIDERYPFMMVIEAVDVPNSIMFLILPSDFKPELEKILNPEKIKIIKIDDLESSKDKIIRELTSLYSVVMNDEN